MIASKNIIIIVVSIALLIFLFIMVTMNNGKGTSRSTQQIFWPDPNDAGSPLLCPWYCQQPAIPPGPVIIPVDEAPLCGGQFSQRAVQTTASPRIIGGEEAQLGDWPWMVYIGGCGGTLIHPLWILSAAHCSFQPGMMVSCGLIDINNPGPNEQRGRIVEVLRHPSYSRQTQANDICLLRLELPMQMTQYVNTACIGNIATDNLPLTVIGWGNTLPDKQPPSPSNMLKLATMREAIPCQGISGTNPQAQICTIGDGSFSCFGDSGGPLHVNMNGIVYVVGVVSFGNSPCNNWTIFTRVSYHLNWIRQYVPGV
jgi:secreted trypsin-like serine protease